MLVAIWCVFFCLHMCMSQMVCNYWYVLCELLFQWFEWTRISLNSTISWYSYFFCRLSLRDVVISDRFKHLNIEEQLIAIPEEIVECCKPSKSCVPCLQELTLRKVYCSLVSDLGKMKEVTDYSQFWPQKLNVHFDLVSLRICCDILNSLIFNVHSLWYKVKKNYIYICFMSCLFISHLFQTFCNYICIVRLFVHWYFK